MREELSQALATLAKSDPKVLLLTGDHGYALFDEFRRVCPDQFLNAGVAEQNMVGVAAGLAKAGFRPIVYGLSAFVPIRVLEQIKIDACYERLPIVFLGDGAGVVYSSLGSSHQSTEDVAALRALPNLSILSPADASELTVALTLAMNASGPVYLRLGKADLGPVHPAPVSFSWGDLLPVRSGAGPLAFVATGSMVRAALDVAGNWPGSAVWSAPSLKPINPNMVIDIGRRHSVIVTLEEHSVYGGLGSAIAEITSAHSPVLICPIGIQDRFSQYCGTYAYLIREHGLDPASICRQINSFLQPRKPELKAVEIAESC